MDATEHEQAVPEEVRHLEEARQMTANNLRQLLAQHGGQDVSILAVPHQEELIEQVAQILPAGNVVNFVFNGIQLAKDREITPTHAHTHLNALLKGLNIMRDGALYPVMFGGPAALLAGYNMLLRLAGAKPEDFLPDGAWQFYVEFGLREDAARHSSETLGFHQAAATLPQPPDELAQLTAWVLAAMWLVWNYHQLLSLIWEEQVRLTALETQTGLTTLHRTWQEVRPFATPEDEHSLGFIEYRRQKFEAFCQNHLNTVGLEQQRAFEAHWNDPSEQEKRKKALFAYVRQLSINASLDHSEYSDRRVPIKVENLHIAVFYRGQYFFLKLVDPAHPASPSHISEQVKSILHAEPQTSGLDLLLAAAPRAQQKILRRKLNEEQQAALQLLATAPVIINWDQADASQPLSKIRGGHRGIGGHALTLFRTERSMVFDFSHIYFDGPWAMAVAEIITNEAINQLRRHKLAAVLVNTLTSPKRVHFTDAPAIQQALDKTSAPINDLSAETQIAIAPLHEMRKTIIQRTRPRIQLTINDLLVLYRTIFNPCYQPSATLRTTINTLLNAPDKAARQLARDVIAMLKANRSANPSLLIPISAERVDPKERIFPLPFRSPFPDFANQHHQLLRMIQPGGEVRPEDKTAFNKMRANYLGTLNAFSILMRRYRDYAISGQSMSTMAIRLIAGLPDAMQRFADGIPGRFAFINEAIKGEEVFSNVGQVVPGSSLSRFTSAKDDNDKKVLVWGIMTDNNGQLCVSLRDFRPPVLALVRAGYREQAQQITQDFVEGYATGLERFAREIMAILKVSKS